MAIAILSKLMTFREVQDQALKLSNEERWQLINVLMRSLQPSSRSTIKPQEFAASLIGIALVLQRLMRCHRLMKKSIRF